MIDFIIASDLHLHTYSDFATIRDGMNSRLLDGLNVVRQMKDYCVENDVKVMVLNGDIYQDRLVIDLDTLHASYKVFEEVSDAGIEIIFNTGNHDQHDKAGNITSTIVLSRLGHVVQYNEVITMGDTKFYVMPFAYDTKPLKVQLRKYAKQASEDLEHSHILLLHQGVDGAYVGAYDFVMKENLKVKEMKAEYFDWVLLGHYHKHQFLAPNVMYTGSPMQLNYGERGKASGFVHVSSDFEKGYKFIKTEAPRFIEVKDTELDEKWLERHPNDFLIIHNDEVEDGELQRLLGTRKCRIIRSRQKMEVQRSEIDTAMADEEILEAYIGKAQVTMDKQKLLDIGLSIMREARA